MHVLIVKTSAFGDIVHAFTALSYLKKKFPYAKIDWVVEPRCAELVYAHPHIDRVILRGSRSKTPYDYLFDLQGNCKSALSTLFAKAKHKIGFGWKTVPEWPNLLATNWRCDPPPGKNIREDYLALVQAPFGEEPFEAPPLLLRGSLFETEARVMICPGSKWPSKQLRPGRLKALCQKIEGPFLFVWGNEKERALCEKIAPPGSELSPKLSLPDLQNTMAQMELVVAMDSLPLHLAGLAGVPTLSCFGPSSSAKYRPLGEHHKSVQGSCPYDVSFEKRCPRLRKCEGPCMENL